MKHSFIPHVCIAILVTSSAFPTATAVVLGTTELIPSGCPSQGASDIFRNDYEEFEMINLSCPTGSVLYITCSHYGRADLTLECTSHPLITASCDEWGLKDGPCVANPEELLRKTQKACDGKSSCSFQANYKVTGHPLTNCDYNPTSGDVAACFWLGEVCPHQVKNAVVSYECVQITDPPPDSSSSDSSSSTNMGLIVGIVCGVILAVAVVAGIGLFILKKRKKQHEEPNFGSSTAIETQEPPIVAIHPPPPPFPPSTAMPELPSKSPLLPSDLPPPSMISTKSTTASNNTVSMAKSPFMDSMLTSTNSQIKTDPILSWVVAKSDVTTTSSAAGGGRAISDRSGSSGPVDIRPWQLPFDDLSIIKVIGEGSFGRVYLAVWHETNVAVKVLLDSSITQSQAATLSLSSPILQKLEAEGSLLASLRHPNIVNFMGVCTFPPAIVTEYCPRGSLTDVLRMAKENAELAQYLTWPRRIAMLTDAAQGMLFLHKHRPPIIHRDLKSPNLLVTEHFKVQISDFNLSKIIQEATATSAVQQTSNSGANNPRWLAVECLSGNKATEASDVFSFGVIMWEMMTFSIPWTGQTNPWSIVRTICDGGRLEIPAQEDVPGGADTANYKGYDDYVVLMNKCWAQEPANRPDFAAVIAALKKLPS
jgi:hypothetical protein